jgi:beta-lactamase class A
MIVNSDNGAKYTLLQHIDSSAVLDVFSSLGVSEPDVPNYVISDKSYARFFKVLYNATYLDADMSERAMELLSQSTFKNGIAATIPTNIPIAHKFGQYTNSGLENSTKAWELSDCGIVYYPNDPYLLCVMTKGVDLNSLSATIQAVSKTVYSEIANKKL